MREFLLGTTSEHRLLRNYVFAAFVLGLLTFLAAQKAANSLAGSESIAQIQPRLPEMPQSTTRQYTITRSVLDDTVATGSISSLKGLKLDPCGK